MGKKKNSRHTLKAFWIGVLSSSFVSIIMLLVAIYMSKPVVIYEIDQIGESDVRFVMRNIGFMPSDIVNLDLLTTKEPEEEPYIRRQYWTKKINPKNFFTIEPMGDTFKFQFFDNGELGELSFGQELEMLILPKNRTESNHIRGYNLSVNKSVIGVTIPVDNIDNFNQSIKYSFLILLLVSIAYLTLGYQFAKSRFISDNKLNNEE